MTAPDQGAPSRRTTDLEALLASGRPVVLDGAMGTELARAGLEMGGRANLESPDEVLAVHRRYVESGAQVLITNTLTMNRAYVESHCPGVDVEAVNRAGAELARKAAGPERWVLGDISSTGRLLEPVGDLPLAAAREAYLEQARVLAAAGVDGFIVETVFDLEEALCALRACREVADLPVLVSMTFCTASNGGRTIMGNTAEQCARLLTEAGAGAIGGNCGDLDPLQTAEVVALLRAATPLPLVAQPNAGKPTLVGREAVYDLPPSDFVTGMAACRDAGARLLGGCCGTSPVHIRALADEVAARPDPRPAD